MAEKHCVRIFRKVIDAATRYQGYGGGVAATRHQEIWLKDANEKEHFIHFTDDEFPVRKGHELEAIYLEKSLVALINYSTNTYINLLPRAHQEIGVYKSTFPDLLNIGHIGLVVAAMVAVAMLLNKHQGAATVFLLLMVGAILIANSNTQKSETIANPDHAIAEHEIHSSLGKRSLLP